MSETPINQSGSSSSEQHTETLDKMEMAFSEMTEIIEKAEIIKQKALSQDRSYQDRIDSCDQLTSLIAENLKKLGELGELKEEQLQEKLQFGGGTGVDYVDYTNLGNAIDIAIPGINVDDEFGDYELKEDDLAG